ncbi:hypothetical protein K439DRAFT_1639099 [Ramaria rubella]|nr:hypothetical protein K439DRAFT_1639099 [Ramaria rubella]
MGLEHCARMHSTAYVPEECTNFWNHAHVPWDWFIDLSEATQHYNIKKLVRNDVTDAFLVHLHIDPSEAYYLNDTDPYQFRFFDSRADARPLGDRYKTRIDLQTLAELAHRHRLLQFGTLFGTTRLRLLDPANIALRQNVRRAMVFANPDLLAIADGVRDSRELGGARQYAAVHLRLGDGVFADREARAYNVRLVWWRLVRELGMSDEDAMKIELGLQGEKGAVTPPAPAQIRRGAALHTSHPPLRHLDPSFRCNRSAVHPLLRIPLYIATDKPNHPLLSTFSNTFSCIYLLSDFNIQLKLDNISLGAKDRFFSTSYDIPLAPFLPPFLDAMIASKARVVVGTSGSTFSRFVEDVLWRTYHGWDVVVRG